jgi:peptide deformylase
MSILKIEVYPAAVLKQKTEPVQCIDDEIRQLAEDMLETMYQAPGVGLAAPQVGRSLRLLVADPGDEEDRNKRNPLVLINPEITEREGQAAINEGCLSVPGFTAEVHRAYRIALRAWTLDEQEIELELEDFPAIVIQHEYDHLDGILFIDRISRLKRNIYERKLKKGTLGD